MNSKKLRPVWNVLIGDKKKKKLEIIEVVANEFEKEQAIEVAQIIYSMKFPKNDSKIIGVIFCGHTREGNIKRK